MDPGQAIPHRSLLVRALAFSFGLVALVLGLTGFFVPGLPGTPFLLVAAWLFSLSSRRLYRWMITNRMFGQIVVDYRNGYGIPRRIKVIAISAVVVAVSTSVTLGLEVLWHRLGLIALGAVGIFFILTRPTTELVREERGLSVARDERR